MSKVVVAVGAQWGDEGKGKIVDYLTETADVVVRYSGGANAGHTLVVGHEKVVLHLMPSGALRPLTQCLIAQGVVIDLEVLRHEMTLLDQRGLLNHDHIKISDSAFIVLPHHKEIDALREMRLEKNTLGTTRRGIGPAYEDKVGRRGVRIADLLDEKYLLEVLERNADAWRPVLRELGGNPIDVQTLGKALCQMGAQLRPYMVHGSHWLNHTMKQGKTILLEGAQGTLLDIDHGTYPFVTSSTATAAGACVGSGIGPRCITHVLGVTKAYTTRVGEGPFPTELSAEAQDILREAGDEFGATTGRPRRCGWLDLPALRHAVRVNGLDSLAITKLDILSMLDVIQVCTDYEVHDQRVSDVTGHQMGIAKPVYSFLQGWKSDISHIKKINDLPREARVYLDFISTAIDCPISMISVGQRRDETILIESPFD